MGLEQSVNEEQKANWLEKHYGNTPLNEEREETEEEFSNPKIENAIYFIIHQNWNECGLTFLQRPCLNVKKIMEKFSIEEKDEELLVQSILEQLHNYGRFDHPSIGLILIPRV